MISEMASSVARSRCQAAVRLPFREEDDAERGEDAERGHGGDGVDADEEDNEGEERAHAVEVGENALNGRRGNGEMQQVSVSFSVV